MLRVTVELIHGGRESSKRILAVAEISNVGGASMAHYHAEVGDESPGLKEADIRAYPRWSTSVWDLVLRCIAKAMFGKEQLPKRPTPVAELAPTYQDAGSHYPYVKVDEIPEPARTEFDRRLSGSSVPFPGHAYQHDWLDFLEGLR